MTALARLAGIAQLARDPRLRVEEIEQQLSADPAFAAEIVRVADSDLHGMEGRIHSLTRALLILGVEAVCAIAALVELRQELRGCEALWLHSLEIGVCSQLLAQWLGLRSEPEAFMAGLLHEFGEAPESAAGIDALLRAAHAICEDDARAPALAELDLQQDDVEDLRSELTQRVKRVVAVL